MMEGVPKSAIDRTKLKIAPELTAGNTSGKVILKNLAVALQPRFSAASSYARLILRKAVSVIR